MTPFKSNTLLTILTMGEFVNKFISCMFSHNKCLISILKHIYIAVAAD